MTQPSKECPSSDSKKWGGFGSLRIAPLALLGGLLVGPKAPWTKETGAENNSKWDGEYFGVVDARQNVSQLHSLVDAFQPGALIAKALEESAVTIAVIQEQNYNQNTNDRVGRNDHIRMTVSGGERNADAIGAKCVHVAKVESVQNNNALPKFFSIVAHEPMDGVKFMKNPYGPLVTNNAIEYSFKTFSGDTSLWLVALHPTEAPQALKNLSVPSYDVNKKEQTDSGHAHFNVKGHLAFRIADLTPYSEQMRKIINEEGWVKEGNEVRLTRSLVADVRALAHLSRESNFTHWIDYGSSFEQRLNTSLGREVLRRLGSK